MGNVGFLTQIPFVECSQQFSPRKTLVEKSFCKHGISRRKVVIIMASPTVSYQLCRRDVCTIGWSCCNFPDKSGKFTMSKSNSSLLSKIEQTRSQFDMSISKSKYDTTFLDSDVSETISSSG